MKISEKYKALAKRNQILIMVYIIGWIFACSSLLFLAYVFWPQLYYWPYDWPETIFGLGKIVVHSIILLMALFFAFLVYLIYQIEITTKKEVRIRLISVILILFFIGSGLTAIGFSTSDVEFRMYDSNPYITWGPNQDPRNAITICWQSSYFTTSEVRYGKNPENLSERVVDFSLKQVHKIAIENLESDTIYYYQIAGREMKSFKTAPGGDSEFSFLFWSDPRTNNPLSSAIEGIHLTKYMYEHATVDGYKWDFSVSGGDITSRGVDYQTWKFWFDDIGFNDFAANQSHLVAVGNHERHDDRGGRWMKHYYPYQQYSDVQFSYSIIYGNVQMVFLDRWIPDSSWYTGDDQYLATWLETEFQKEPNVRFRLIFIHVNPAIGDEHHGNNTNIMKTTSQYNVSAIFCGHSHSYSTSYFNGTTFNPSITPIIDSKQGNGAVMQVGLGGNTNNNGIEMYLRVDVNLANITIQPITFDHSMLTTYTII